MTGKESEVTPAVVEETLTFGAFLETIHPNIQRKVTELWVLTAYQGSATPRSCAPVLRLHCSQCDGVRTFRSDSEEYLWSIDNRDDIHLIYTCGDCHSFIKRFSLSIERDSKIGFGEAYKYGELPPYGVPVPNKLLRLFGRDSKIFLKGRQCENQGLGVGAFAYYRRVVENHKNDIFDEILRVCETVNAPEPLMAELREAKNEISFSSAVDKIKSGLPQGLLIDGHNPLMILHSALSKGIHSSTDEECLGIANAVRLVLADLSEKTSTLRQDDAELKSAVRLLLGKNSK